MLYDVALRLLEAVPLRIETRSKAERGYDLVDGARRPLIVHAQAFAIEPDMTVDAVLHGLGLNCLAPVLKNVPAALAGAPDAIHQMRVVGTPPSLAARRGEADAVGRALPLGQ